MSNLMRKLRNHPLIDVLVGLRGNQRVCIYTEPLWGIPYNLYIPFFTVYQHALGVSDRQIGFLLSLSMLIQVVTALLGGILTDRFGRRMVTFVVDLVVWSLPVLIWSLAQNFIWFLAATLFNGMWQITSISWTCLLVEDCDHDKLVPMFTWITISGLLSVFFAPLSGLLVSRTGVIPAMRVLLFLTFILMTVKFTILFFLSTETKQGKIRMRETRHLSMPAQLGGYGQLAAKMIRMPGIWQILALLVFLNVSSTVLTNFFALHVTLSLGVPEAFLAYFPIGRAAIMLIAIFTVQTTLNRWSFRVPMMTGLGLYLASQLLLLTAPAGRPGFFWLYVVCEAMACALVAPQKDSLVVLSISPAERPRMVSLLYVAMIGLSAPFGWIAGALSQQNRSWPFIMNFCLYLGCLLLVTRMKGLGAAGSQTALKGDITRPGAGMPTT